MSCFFFCFFTIYWENVPCFLAPLQFSNALPYGLVSCRFLANVAEFKLRWTQIFQLPSLWKNNGYRQVDAAATLWVRLQDPFRIKCL